MAQLRVGDLVIRSHRLLKTRRAIVARPDEPPTASPRGSGAVEAGGVVSARAVAQSGFWSRHLKSFRYRVAKTDLVVGQLRL